MASGPQKYFDESRPESKARIAMAGGESLE